MANIFTLKSGLSSDPTVWSGGVVPSAADRVLICTAHVVELDGVFEWGGDSTASIVINGVTTTRSIAVAGTLKHSRTVSSKLTCVGMVGVLAGGRHDMGTEADPILLPVTAQLVLNKSAAMATNKYGYEAAETAQVTAWGSPKLRTAHLAAPASAGSSSIQVTAASGWQAGDDVAISQTDIAASFRQGFGVIAAGYIPGALTVPLVTPLAFNHATGALVGNGSNNVTVKSYSFSQPSAAFHLYGGQADTPGARELGNITFDTLAGTYPAYGLAVRFSSNYSDVAWPQIYRAMKGVTLYKRNQIGASSAAQLSDKCSAATPILYEDMLVVGAHPTDDNSITVTPDRHCRQVRCVYLNASYDMAGVTDTSLEDCTLIGRRREALLANGSSALDVLRLKLGGYTLGSGVIGHNNPTALANDLLFTDCDFGVTYPLSANSPLFFFQTSDSRFSATAQDCVFGPNVTEPSLLSMGNLTNESVVKVVNKNKDVAEQAEYRKQGVYRRDNTVKLRGSSSISMRPNFVARACVRSQKIPCANGSSVRVVGYVKMDTVYLNGGNCNAPTVAITGLGIIPAIFTMALNTEWQQFDLGAVNASGFDGSFTLAFSATPKAVATGTVYLDGVPDAPFVTKVRHYGFMFEEGSPIRTVNPVAQATEAIAAAYTGVTINPATPKITVGAGTANTWRKLYDYYQAWACLNIDSLALLTSADGANFALPLSCRIEWPGMPANGTLSGGWLQLAAPGVHSYSLSGTKIEFMAAGTYNMGGSQLGGTVELVNTSGGAVVVQMPIGASYTNTGPSITVTLPSIDALISAPALIAGTRVQLYSITGGAQIYNAAIGAGGASFTLPYTAPIVVRLRADHNTKLPIQTLGVLSAAGLTFLDVQDDDTVYMGNGIDGSTCTEFSPDGPNIQVDISDPDGTTEVQRLYAWLQWYMQTEEGIASPLFDCISAIDAVNYKIDVTKVDLLLDNISQDAVHIKGAYLYRSDGTTLVAPGSKSIFLDAGKAYGIEVGTTGLTPSESLILSSLAKELSLQTMQADVATLLARPVPPTVAQVVTGVWADPAAAALALEATAQAIKADSAALVARPVAVAPTALEVTAAVWADPAAAALALEATAQQVVTAEGEASAKLDALLARPVASAAATPAQVADAVWQHSFTDRLLTVAKFLWFR